MLYNNSTFMESKRCQLQKGELHCLLSALLSPNLEANEKSETGAACTR